MTYTTFLKDKESEDIPVGFDPDESIYPVNIKDHQRVSVTWACKRGRSALFFDTGLGKTLAQLTWAHQVVNHTDGIVLILAPLAVAHQTVREGCTFNVPCTFVTNDNDINGNGVYITNYEKLHHFACSKFTGIVLDESSILKGMNGKMRRFITDSFIKTPYKLSCTATPSPNDFMELGTQAEFLGIMSQTEMLAMYFIHDGSDTSKWRLKGHGKMRFWEWLSSWAIFLTTPADLGFDGSEYDLPEIKYHRHIVITESTTGLFAESAQSLLDRNRARKESVDARCLRAADIVSEIDGRAVIWCNLNDESKKLNKLIDDSVEVTGSDSDDHKTKSLLGFVSGDVKYLISKPKIAGFGLNMQSSNHCIFVGLSDSWEAFYQAIRRQWRFGQTKTVHVHIVYADTEGAVIENIRRKDMQHKELSMAMMNKMRDLVKKNVLGVTADKTEYTPNLVIKMPDFLSN